MIRTKFTAYDVVNMALSQGQRPGRFVRAKRALTSALVTLPDFAAGVLPYLSRLPFLRHCTSLAMRCLALPGLTSLRRARPDIASPCLTTRDLSRPGYSQRHKTVAIKVVRMMADALPMRCLAAPHLAPQGRTMPSWTELHRAKPYSAAPDYSTHPDLFSQGEANEIKSAHADTATIAHARSTVTSSTPPACSLKTTNRNSGNTRPGKPNGKRNGWSWRNWNGCWRSMVTGENRQSRSR